MPGVPQQGISAPIDVPIATPQPFRSPGSFGEDVGTGLEQLGSVMEQDQVRAKEVAAKRQYEVDASAAGVAAAQAQGEAAQQIVATRENAAPGAAGHVEAVGKVIDQTVQPVLASITNPVLRGQFAEDFARFKAGKVAEESAWASGQRVAYQVTNVKQTAQTLGNNVLNQPDDATFGTSLKTLATTIGNQGLPADKGEALFREQAQDVAEARAKGLTLTDPASAITWLGGDQAANYLPADRRAALIGQAETQLRIGQADARRATALTAEQWSANVSLTSTHIGQGALPSDDDFNALVAQGKALEASDPTGQVRNKLDQLQYDEGKLKLSRVVDKWTSAEWDQAINPLAAKVAQGKASEDEQRTLKILQELRGPKEQKIANDPDGVSAANGVPPPVVDLDNPDPNAITARKSWAQGFARTYGKVEPPYLNGQQLTQLRQEASAGPVAQLQVAEQLRSTWGLDAAPSIVRQIGGDAKNDMMVMLGLNPGVAQIYRQGHDALEKKAVELNDGVARQVAATVLRGVPADMRPAVFDAARNIAAGWMQRQGYTSIPSNFADVFAGALQLAGGRSGDVKDFNSPGGFAELNGRYAWLPSDMNSYDFLRRVARAQPQDWVNAATDAAGNPVKSVPHYVGPDGKLKPYTKGDALRFNKGTFETVAPGIYHLVDPMGHTVVDEKRQPWTFDIRRLRGTGPPAPVSAEHRVQLPPGNQAYFAR